MINNIRDREQDKGVVLIGRIQKKLRQPQMEKTTSFECMENLNFSQLL